MFQLPAHAPERLLCSVRLMRTVCTSTQVRDHPNAYNEVLVSTAEWDAHLPDIVEAIFYIEDDSRARQVHRAFHDAYPERAAFTPLLQYLGASGGFREVPN